MKQTIDQIQQYLLDNIKTTCGIETMRSDANVMSLMAPTDFLYIAVNLAKEFSIDLNELFKGSDHRLLTIDNLSLAIYELL